MEEFNYIEDTALPLELNFALLKDKALTYIQRNNKGTWTNLNQSDPGVTILDQLCYALTELGYCNNFPIKDVLTNKEGKLKVKNQFYLPENILTTSPLSIDDFRKFVIDNTKNIANVQISPVKTSINASEAVYKTSILIDRTIDKTKKIEVTNYKKVKKKNTEGKEVEEVIEEKGVKTLSDIILENTFFILNKCRNLGELFLFPTILNPVEYSIKGNLELANGADLNTVLIAIEKAINNYVYPKLLQKGYEEIKKEELTTNEIFNGPKLKNGWISDDNMQAKRNRIQVYEITEIIKNVEGVVSITDVVFLVDEVTKYEVKCDEDEILVFVFLPKIDGLESNLKVNLKGRYINTTIKTSSLKELSFLEESYGQICKVSRVRLAPNLPEGKYRDISSYFSIQNTFPDAYKVGIKGVSANASDFEIAQSRQLKGYLTLFDQVLTNQFMQLSNIGGLFSFENAVTGDPTDREQFYSVKTAYEKHHLKYPVPYISFSPTYYYQSLYKEVPHIRPLLKNFQKHDFVYGLFPFEEGDNGWAKYQIDPYNSYIWGLLSFMEDETVNLERRNNLLDNLLARHGESPSVIDIIIEGTVYSGNSQKDKVILKSLYLQNLGLLSYYRMKAYDYIGAMPLKKICEGGNLNIQKTKKNKIFEFKKIRKLIKGKREEWLQGNQKDFIFNTVKVNEEQRITENDFINFSAVELKINLLFALNTYYQDYLIDHVDFCAYWLITQRKGFLCIETNLLKESADFEIIITEKDNEKKLKKITNKIVIKDNADHQSSLKYNDVLLIEYLLKKKDGLAKVKDRYNVEIINSIYIKEDFKVIESTPFLCSVNAFWNDTLMHLSNSFFNNSLIFIFPDFFVDKNKCGKKDKKNRSFKISDFKNRFNFFLENDLPVQVVPENYFVNNGMLKKLIVAYSNWYNSLRFNQNEKKIYNPKLKKNAEELVKLIVELNTNKRC